MAYKSYLFDPGIYQYLLSHTVQEPAILRKLREETDAHPRSSMQISPEQAKLNAIFLKMLGARKVIEVGVFTGYSSTAAALALPEDGRLVACDISEEFTNIAKRYWQEAGVAHKIDFRLGPAAESLTQLIKEGQGGTFDFAFIDADKTSYANYYELCLQLLRPGGLIALDNMLWDAKVIDASDQSADTVAIRALNDALIQDPRVLAMLLPLADGIALAVKL